MPERWRQGHLPHRIRPAAASEGHILFGRTTGGDWSVDYTANADGTDERQLARRLLLPKDLAGRVAHHGHDRRATGRWTDHRYTVAANGSDPVRLPLTDPTLNLVPQASCPDGTRMAFEGWDDSIQPYRPTPRGGPMAATSFG